MEFGSSGQLRGPWTVVTAVAAALSLVAGGAMAGSWLASRTEKSAPARAERAPTARPLVGVFRGTDESNVVSYAQWLGRPVDLVVDFSARDTWEQIAKPDYLLSHWQGGGRGLVLGVPMLPERDDSATIARGAAGDYDQHFQALARRLVATGHPDAVLRVGWEFNTANSRWGTPDADAFRAYWRRIAKAMRSVQGQRFALDWNVNNGDGNRYDAVGYYPGDDVVDYVGVDAYDQSGRAGTYPYPQDCDDGCRSQRQRAAWDEQIYGGSRGLKFWAQFAAKHGRLLSVPEWGLWSRSDGTGGGDNPFYIERMVEFFGERSNAVAYQAYFEFDGDDGQHSLMGAFARSGDLYRWLVRRRS